MAKEEDILEGFDKEEDLLDFDLEDITPEVLTGADSGLDEDVIELVDLVEEGNREQGARNEASVSLVEEDLFQEGLEDIIMSTDEISAIPDILEDEEAREEEAAESADDLPLSDLEPGVLTEETKRVEWAGSEEATEKASTRPVEDLDIGEEAVFEEGRPEAEIDLSGLFDEDSTEEPEVDLEAPTDWDDDLEAILGETIEATVVEEEISSEDMESEQVAQVEPAPAGPEAEAPPMAPSGHEGEGRPVAPAGAPAISEERIEAIVSEVVQEVVERVARETMATVAEKLITEAIEALKQSLESSSE